MVAHLEEISLLQQSPLFAAVPETELRQVAARLHPVHADTGEAVMREGDPGKACYFIATGQVGVLSKDIIGAPAMLATFGRGACVGEVALVTGGTRTATVQATEPTDLLALEEADFVELQSLCPVFAERVRHRVAMLAVDSFLQK